jgi:hypothetical protein
MARALPSTTQDPHLLGATPPLSHTIGGRWDCCPDERKTELGEPTPAPPSRVPVPTPAPGANTAVT